MEVRIKCIIICDIMSFMLINTIDLSMICLFLTKVQILCKPLALDNKVLVTLIIGQQFQLYGIGYLPTHSNPNYLVVDERNKVSSPEGFSMQMSLF